VIIKMSNILLPRVSDFIMKLNILSNEYGIYIDYDERNESLILVDKEGKDLGVLPHDYDEEFNITGYEY